MSRIAARTGIEISFFKRIASRVGRKLTFVLVAVILMVEGIVLIPSYFGLKRDLLEQARSESVAALTAALQVEMAMHEGKVSEVGDFLSEQGFLRGGVLFDVGGTERGSFGIRPALTLSEVEDGGRMGLLLQDGAVFEFFVPHQETGLIFNAILSTDATGIPDRLWTFVTNVGLIVLFLAVTCICGIACALDIVVLRRILTMRSAVIQASDRPDIADRFTVEDSIRDEVGDLGRAQDLLLYAVSNTYQEDLAAALAITEQSSIATLIYSAEGALIGANRAALMLFKADIVETLAGRERALVAFSDAPPVDPLSRIADGAFDDKGFAIVLGTRVPCLIAGQTITRGDGAALRHFVTLIDLSHQEELIQIERDRRQAAEDRGEELRASLKACLSLLSATGAADDPTSNDQAAVIVLPDRLIGDWVVDMKRQGRITEEDMEHGVLPPILGQQGLVEDLLRNTLTLCLMRVGGRGRIMIEVNPANDERCDYIFTSSGTSSIAMGAQPSQEAEVVASAVRLLAGRIGGAALIEPINGPDGRFQMSLTLRIPESAQELAV